MSFVKRQLEEEEARGWRSLGGKHACLDHIENAAIAAHLEDRLTASKCDYCGRNGDVPIATDVDELIGLVADSLKCEWNDPNDEGVAWDGGWAGSPHDTRDLLDLLEEGHPFNNVRLTEDVCNAFGGREWVQRDYYRLPLGERLELGWDEFSETVKHRSRYFFMAEIPDDDDPDDLSPSEVLWAVGQAITRMGLVKALPVGTLIYRARPHESGVTLRGAVELGPPLPEQVLGANRMSPAGIAHFYGALEKDTAFEEAVAADAEEREILSIAAFRPMVDIAVVDISAMPPIPSLFSTARELRPMVSFLRHFVERISVPVPRDDRNHVDYVPSQVVTEWFRQVFVSGDDPQPIGLLYPSARQTNGRNIVLFIDRNGVADPGTTSPGSVLELVEVGQRRRPRADSSRAH